MLRRSIAQDSPARKYVDTIGLQLWTVRNQLQEDIPGTLKAVADAGYHQVELGSVMDADQYVPVAKDLGMQVTSSFMDWQSIANPAADGAANVDEIVAKAKDLGLKHLVFGYIGKGYRETVDQYKAHAERANAAGEKCQAAGIQLCYHNHSFEFAKLQAGSQSDQASQAEPVETTGWDVFVAEFDPKLVKFEVDVFWVKIGGRNPFKTMRKLKGRISQVHLKDLKKGSGVIHDEGKVPADAFQELGEGTIDMVRAMKVAAKAGAEQCHVEQDQSPNPIQSINDSLKHLKSIQSA